MVDSCYGCTDRRIDPVNCHSYCKDYLQRLAKHKANKESLAEKDIRRYVSEQKYKSKRTREKRK